MQMAPNCIFCAIVAGEAPCTPIIEDETVMAFMDIHPANEGHCLVIPKMHYPTLFETPPEVFAAVARLVVRVSLAVQAALRPPGLNLLQANGAAAGQSVSHVHVHVLPRRPDDGLALNWSRTAPADPAKIAAIAEQIRRHLPPA